jgi:WD40 repeat protein
MPTEPDYLDRLWSEVVNIDPEGKWIDRGIAACRSLKKGPYSKCAPALERLRDLGSAEDLGRVSRESRYGACFDILCSFDDPGLTRSKLPRVIQLLEQSFSGKASPPKSVAGFWRSLQVMLDPGDDGKWLVEFTKRKEWKREFGDLGPAVKRLRKAGATFGNLGRMVAWSRYEAGLQALRLLIESGVVDEEEIGGLHEVFLSADPSVTEAGPKSWPLPQQSSTPAKKATNSQDLTKPLWKVRSGQAIAFSPDGKTVALAGASGPVRLMDAASGEDRLTCEGLKAHIFEIAFSPDGKWVAAAQVRKWVTICDASTGRLTAKIKLPDDEVSGLVFSSKTGELIHSAWGNVIHVIDSATGKTKEPLQPAVNTHMINCISFTPDERKLVAVWFAQDTPGKKHCTVWSWPDREELNHFLISESISDVAVSPDGLVLAVPFSTYQPKGNREGVHLIDVSSGKVLRTITMNGPRRVVFIPKEEILIVSSGDDDCRLFDTATGKTIFTLPAVGDVCCLAVSRNGKHLAAATSFSGAACWHLPSIIKAAKGG